MKYTYRMFEDNAGFLHLAVLDENDVCIYYLFDADRALVMDTMAALENGGDPIADSWEGGEEDPVACFDEILARVDARNGGASEIDC